MGVENNSNGEASGISGLHYDVNLEQFVCSDIQNDSIGEKPDEVKVPKIMQVSHEMK